MVTYRCVFTGARLEALRLSAWNGEKAAREQSRSLQEVPFSAQQAMDLSTRFNPTPDQNQHSAPVQVVRVPEGSVTSSTSF